MSLLDTITQQLGGDTMSQLSRQIGADPQTTQNAVQMALPVLLGGLARNASNPAGASALDNALAKDHDGSMLDNLGSLLGNPQSANGGGILGHVFGGRREPVEAGVAQASGLSAQQTGKLLMILAPIVMAALGRMKRNQGMDAGGVGDVLQRESSTAERQLPGGLGGMLGGLLDRNNDGSVMDDIGRMTGGLGGLGGMLGGGGTDRPTGR